LGGELKLPDLATTNERHQQLSKIQGLMEHIDRLGAKDRRDAGPAAAAAEMILEGLWAHRRIGRSEERGYYAEKPKQPDQRESREGPPRPRAANSTKILWHSQSWLCSRRKCERAL